MASNLRKKTIQGISWNALATVLNQLTTVIVTFILARLLEPSDFGLIAFVMILVGFAEKFSDMGLGPAIIQRKEILVEQLSSIFWLNIAIGFFFGFSFYISASFFASFYDELRLIRIIKVASVSFIITGISLIHSALLRKSLKFKEVALSKLLGVIVGGILGIVLALQGFGVWALVFKLLASRFISSISYIMRSKWIPKLHFNFTDIKSLVQFGINFTGIRVLLYWSRKLDDLLIGKFIGVASLGIYSNAYKLLMLPIKNIKTQVINVAFPAISTIQEDPARIKRIVLKLVQGIAILAYPLMVGLFFTADEFVLVLLGEKWAEMIPLVKLFSLASLFDLIVFPEAILAALDKTRNLFLLTLGTRIFFLLCIIMGLNWGIYGVAVGVSISMVINFFPLGYFSGREINLNPLEILKEVMPIAGVCLLMGLILVTCHWGLADKVSLTTLLVLKVSFGFVFYITYLWNSSNEIVLLLKKKILK